MVPTVEDLARRYVEDYLTSKSNRYREKHEYLLRSWILPAIGARPVIEWTSAESEKVLASVRKLDDPARWFRTSGAPCEPSSPTPAASAG